MASRIRQYLDGVAQLHHAGVIPLASVILFGSAASGAFSESSDVDLIIVIPDETSLEDRRLLSNAVRDLEILHGLRFPERAGQKTLWRSSLNTPGGTHTPSFSAPEVTSFREK